MRPRPEVGKDAKFFAASQYGRTACTVSSMPSKSTKETNYCNFLIKNVRKIPGPTFRCEGSGLVKDFNKHL